MVLMAWSWQDLRSLSWASSPQPVLFEVCKIGSTPWWVPWKLSSTINFQFQHATYSTSLLPQDESTRPPPFAYLLSLHHFIKHLYSPIPHTTSKVCFLEHKSHHFSPFFQSLNHITPTHTHTSPPLGINHKLLRTTWKSFLIPFFSQTPSF